MDKELKFELDARKSLLNGMDILARAVGSTLGPKGQCVVIDDYANEKPLITKDGVTVAKNIQLKNKFENLGVQLLREASIASVIGSGDGTTSTIVLAHAFITKAAELIENGKNPIELKSEIKEIADSVLTELKNQAIPIKDTDLEKVATISANNDLEIGKLIADAFSKITKDGVITVEESPSIRTYTEVINGMQFNRGYESPHFATDLIKGICTLENCYVFLTDQKVQSMKDIIPVLEIARSKSKPILLIAQDYDDEAIQNLKLNKLRGILQVCAVKAPLYGNYRSQVLEDLAILTGGKVVTYESGIELQKVTESMLGYCSKVNVTKETTTIVGGEGKKELIDARVNQIKQELENISDQLDADFLKEFYAQRIAKLVGGVAVIYVGGTTELEMKEKKDRIDDAVCATKAAIEEGIVPGGGLSFIIAGNNTLPKFENSDALNIIADGLCAVNQRILLNCGILPGDSRWYVEAPRGIAYDAVSGKHVNMIEAGIINPVKSDRLALENALSVLNLYLSSNCLVINKEIEL